MMETVVAMKIAVLLNDKKCADRNFVKKNVTDDVAPCFVHQSCTRWVVRNRFES